MARPEALDRSPGPGAVLNDALADLGRLPADAWEREVAVPCLVEARFEIPQDAEDEAERGFIMSTQDLYEEWKQKTESAGRRDGLELGQKRSLIRIYEARFGSLPAGVRAAIDATHDPAKLDGWVTIMTTRAADEIAALLEPATST